MDTAGFARLVAPRAGRVRWDRFGRVVLVLVLVGVLGLYVGPAISWVTTWRDAAGWRAEVRRLEAEHARLAARRDALTRPSTLEREARQLGMVRAGERPYVVTGLPPG
jgi:cell division protein FtsB